MNILQICNKIPYPPSEGGSIAINTITEGLINAGHSVKVLAMMTPKNVIDVANLNYDYIKNTQIKIVNVDTRVTWKGALLNLFSNKSYNISRFVSTAFEKALIDILSKNTYDIVQLEGLYLTPYIDTIRKYSKAKIILRAHNVEHIIWNRIAYACENTLKRQYIKILARRLKRFEVSVINKCDAIAAITDNDAKIFKLIGCEVPIIDLTFGIDIHKYPIKESLSNETTLFHIGSMDWMPNEEGIKWFINNVFNKLSEHLPDIKFFIAGKNMPKELFKLKNKNIINLGEIKDALSFINNNTIMIVPLLSGSGIRIKIIEGMALGKTVITTSIGAEGIQYTENENIIIANTPEEYIDSIKRCIADKNYCCNIGKKARKLIEEKYSNDIIIQKLISFYNLVSNNKSEEL